MRLTFQQCLGLAVVFCLSGLQTDAFQIKASQEASNWELCSLCGIPARIGLNSSPGPTLVPRRHIYLLIQPQDFNEENLKTAFKNLASEYPDPIFLRIIAFSNKDYLVKLMKAEESRVIIDFADDKEARTAQQEYYSAIYPPQTGYYRAYYLRSSKAQESFQYTVSPDDKELIEVIVRKER